MTDQQNQEPLNPEAPKSRVRRIMERWLNKPYDKAHREMISGFAAIVESYGPEDREDLDPFSTANMNRRINRLHEQTRSNEIKKLAQQIMVTHPETNIHDAINRATYIYDTTTAYTVTPTPT